MEAEAVDQVLMEVFGFRIIVSMAEQDGKSSFQMEVIDIGIRMDISEEQVMS